MKSINKKIIVTILVIIEIMLINITYKSYSNRIIDEKEIENKRVAIKVDNGNNEYKDSETLPGRGYVLNTELTECLDIEGNKLNKSDIKSDGESVTLTGKYTSYCTLYFYLIEDREYNYTGDYQVFIAPKTGNYKIELWGASGGEVKGEVFMTLGNSFGRGAYTKGIIHLNKNEKLYVYVGENNNENGQNLSKIPFNGGGPGESSGGGATDVRLEISEDGSWDDFNSLKSRIMVAAGGGGGAYYLAIDTSQEYRLGDGGSLKGIDAKFYYNGSYGNGYEYSGHGGTQTSGGEPGTKFSSDVDSKKILEMTGKFGKGGYGINANGDYTYTSSGGGGGYYGGGHGNHPGDTWTGGGGGSSYISGYLGCIAIKEESTEDNVLPKDGCIEETNDINCSYHYSNKIFIDTEMKAGSESMPTHDGSNTMIGNTGNGYAKITFVN